MQTQPMKLGELADMLGTTGSHIAYAHRDGKDIRGHRIECEEQADGTKLWFAIGEFNDRPEAGKHEALAETEAEDETEDETEPAQHLDTAEGIHGRTLSALLGAGLTTAAELAEYVGDVTTEEAVNKLTGVPGVGPKGAADTVAWLESTGWVPARGSIETFSDLNVGETFEADTRIGKHDFEVLEPGHHEDTGSPFNAKWLSGPHEGERCYFSASFQLVEFQAEEPEPEPQPKPEPQSNPHPRNATDGELVHAEFDLAPADGEHEIRCPWCAALFDAVAAGTYESGEATCHDDDGQGTRGDCGQKFMVIAEADGYRTEKITNSDVSPASETASGAPPSNPEATSSPDAEVDHEVTTEAHPEHGSTAPASSPSKPKRTSVPKFLTVPIGERPHPALPQCRALGTAPAHSDDWFALRARGVGSSDAGAILGVSEHATIIDVWASKVGRPQDAKPWLDEYADFGTWFEPHLLRRCAEESGVQIVPGHTVGTLQSAAIPILCANLDGFDTTGVLDELKTTESKWDSVPEAYYAQVQHQMAVTGAPEARVRQFISPVPRRVLGSLREVFWEMFPFPFEEDGDARLAAWLLDQGEIHTWIVERNPSYIERMVDRHLEFWAHVESKTEPDIPDPEGTVDLTDDPEVYMALEQWAEQKMQNGILKSDLDLEKEYRRTARKAIERAISLLPAAPKRIKAGEHHATFVNKKTHSYWSVYAGEIDEIEI